MPEFIRLASGVTFKEISKTVFRTLALKLPSRDVVDGFEQIASPMMRQIQNLETQNANLRTQRDLLLLRLVSGVIDVSEAELEGAAA